MIGTPRIQARVGLVDHPPDLKGKWSFEILVSIIGHPEKTTLNGGLYDTEKIAQREMRAAVKVVSEKIQTKLLGNTTGEFLDLKENVVRRWEEN